MLTLEGTVQKIVFRNEENLYTIARIEDVKDEKNTTIVGKFSSIGVGETYILHGDWVVHKTYGRQFSVETYEEKLPASEYGIEKYLGSGLIKGIGPKTAKKLVEHFGSKVFDIIETEPEKLTEVKGLRAGTIEKLVSSFSSQRQMKNILSYLAGFDISPAYAVKIYQQYGMDCIEVLKTNPYKLAEDIWGIGFKIADKIARKIGIPMDSPFRISAFILYQLQEATNSGHLFLIEEELLAATRRDMGIAPEIIEKCLDDMKKNKMIVIEDTSVYLRSLYELEKNVAKKLKVFANITSLQGPSPKEIFIIEKRIGVELSPSQREALYEAFSSGILIITGGPGTGKTTIIKSIILWAEELSLSVSLGAPTGRAAKRLSEATGRKAMTIHRLLGFIPTDGSFAHNEKEPLDADVIIIDEASMVDIYLFNSLLKGLSPETRIILVGDVDQLPSVGPGNVLSDLINSHLFKTIYLKTIFRQAMESHIILNSHRINEGQYPVFQEKSDFSFLNIEEPEKIAELIIKISRDELREFISKSLENVQILSPMHKGPIGVQNLNMELQKVLNPPSRNKKEIKSGNHIFREGDKVMQIVNNYKKQVFNGDIGRIEEIDPEEQEVWIKFNGDDLIVSYEFQELGEMVLAYACTIHKSQGSEYPVVIIPVSTQHYIMLQRNLIYTAVTRAKKQVILIGTSKALHIAINNSKVSKRNTKLVERLLKEG